MTYSQRIIKRTFDIFFSTILLLLLWPIILMFWIFATIDTRSNGFYLQSRIGRGGRKFKVIKIKTMINSFYDDKNITLKNDPRVTRFGGFLRSYKIDELPQLINVLIGQMSFVGPRPDVEGYADKLEGNEKLILSVRPGITGPASIKYYNEEEILMNQIDPYDFNDKIIWPDKVKINMQYIENWSLKKDIYFIFKTLR